jgi:hypothetical protein
MFRAVELPLGMVAAVLMIVRAIVERVLALKITAAARASIGYVLMIAGISRKCAYATATNRIAGMLFLASLAGLTAAVMVTSSVS